MSGVMPRPDFIYMQASQISDPPDFYSNTARRNTIRLLRQTFTDDFQFRSRLEVTRTRHRIVVMKRDTEARTERLN